MAENEQERTEHPTPKRLEEARKKGQVPRSVDLSTATVLLVAGGALRVFGGGIGSALAGVMRSALSLDYDPTLDPRLAITTAAAELLHALIACAPVFGLTMVAALAAPLALGGWNLSFEALAPDFSRLDPVSGFGRVFSVRALVELGKALAKVAVVGTAAYLVLRDEAPRFLALGSEPLAVALAQAVALASDALLIMAGTLGLIAAIDVPWQLFQHNKQLRMTREEIREEMKESDGSPENKMRVRRVQRELLRRRMMHEVPKADVVVTNPTHFAVALRYDESRMRAPRVVAKGADLIAARIREIATEHAVPIFEAPPLARALYHNVEIGGEIPGQLYVAVAQILTYIYRLKAARACGDQPPEPPVIDPSIETTRH